MFSGDLRLHRKLLTIVGASAFICIAISYLKSNMSMVNVTGSHGSDCRRLRSRHVTPLPMECHDRNSRVKLSNLPILDRIKESKRLPATLSQPIKVEEPKSMPNRTLPSSRGDNETKSVSSYSATIDNGVYKTGFKFTINEENLCKTGSGPPVVLVVGVFSGRDEAPIRKYIRANWGKVVNQNQKVKIVFILGVSKKNSLFDETPFQIRNESNTYHDIVEANFEDTYRNLTLKSLALFQWIGSYCKEAEYVLKIDGDMMIDLSHLLSVLEKGNFPDKYQCGYLINPYPPDRDKNSKWYVPESLLPGNFPLYCAGPAYVVSKRIAEKISHHPIPKVFFPVDDVFMTGLLREELHEGVEKRIISFYHHHNPTDIVVQEGKFKKYIMKIDVKD